MTWNFFVFPWRFKLTPKRQKAKCFSSVRVRRMKSFQLQFSVLLSHAAHSFLERKIQIFYIFALYGCCMFLAFLCIFCSCSARSYSVRVFGFVILLKSLFSFSEWWGWSKKRVQVMLKYGNLLKLNSLHIRGRNNKTLLVHYIISDEWF